MSIIYFRKIFKVLVVFVVGSFVLGCMSAPHEHPAASANKSDPEPTSEISQLYNNRENAVTRTTDDSLFQVSLYSNVSPLPLKKIHSWTVHIETQAGKPLENAKVYIYGGMPAHKHDFPTKPRVTEYLGNGDYMVEGVKFSMPGHWQMRFNIIEKNQRDRVVFDVNL